MSYISFKLCNKKRVFKKVRIFEILFLECLLCAVRDGFRKFGHICQPPSVLSEFYKKRCS